MKAIVTTRYGDPEVLQLREVSQPVPAADEVLIKLYASSVNPLDSYVIRGPLFFFPAAGGLLKPKDKIAGADIAGRVESVGDGIIRFQPGDEVFGACFGGNSFAGFAEYVCVKEDRIALKPANLSFAQAAAVPVAAISALQGLRDHGKIKPGQSVLIDGASGGVGTFAVQIAKLFGAKVTAVCGPAKMETARSLGADRVIDYTREDFTRSGQLYDLILAANAHHSIFSYARVLSRDGTLVVLGGAFSVIFQALLLGPMLARLGGKKTRFFVAKINAADLDFLKSALETGGIAPFIDRCYPLSETAEAFRYREEGHAAGKVVITIC